MIRSGTDNDIDKLEELYDELNDYLENSINYPGWKKGVYPTREDAVNGIKEGTLYVAIINDEIAGTIILNHKSDSAYSKVTWQRELDYSNVYVIHTFAVHPKYFNHGVGKALIEFANEHGTKNDVEALRLDVYEGNLPAIKLYEKCGFKYIDKIDLGLESYGLKWFRVYEKLIKKELHTLNRDSKERELYYMREKSLKDEISALANAEEKGIEKGMEKGIIESAKKLMSILDDDTISDTLGIDIDIVKSLRNDN